MDWLQNMLKKHRMGLRIVKTGIAVTVCVAVSFLLKLNQPIFAVVATVMSMGKSIDISFKAGKNKMVGVVIGVAVGYGFAAIAPANAGLCGIGIILTLYLCQLFRLTGAATLSCFLFAAMMFMHGFGTHLATWQFALACVVDSLIGIAVALLVNLIIMPPNYTEEIKMTSVQIAGLIRATMEDAEARRPLDVRAVEAAIQRLDYNVGLYAAEAKLLRWNDKEVFQISCRISTYQQILDEMKAIRVVEMEWKDHGSPEERAAVYRYHMSRMQELSESLREADNTGPESEKAPEPGPK